jgi:YaiO family outer membrane protein
MFGPPVFCQDNLTTDDLFVKARKTAFEDDNYPEAIALTKMALDKSPDYLELGVFLGRLYTFTDSIAKARTVFREVLQKEQGHEDASLAYGNLEYWNDDSATALEIVDNGIAKHPKSEGLLLLKAKILKDMKRYADADRTINDLLEVNPKLTEARALSQRIKLVSAKNILGLSYDYVYFDKRFDDPWHLASLDYGRLTKIGSVTARINYANRFNSNGLQFELDAYPRLSNLFYTYVSGGISDKDGIFPHYRAGFSLYANLPAAFEADAGFRLLVFDDRTWVYTVGVGKYYKNYWFNLRTYLTPSNSSVSHSYALNVRYYLGGADDYLSFNVGTGISPDDNANSVLFDPNNIYRLKSSNIALGYRTTIHKTNVVFIQASLENQEYARDTRGNQFTMGLGYIKRF